jgi:hypothetical protein
MYLSKSRRRRALVAAVPLALLAALWFAIASFASVATDSGFEDNDGNLAPASGGFDWNSFGPLAAADWIGTP